MTQKRLSLGKWGEDQAARYLRKKRFRIVERNYTCPLGEIDIIARYKGRLVFIEVKTKSSGDNPLPRYSVNRRKQRQIIRVAHFYLKGPGRDETGCRFDVVEVISDDDEKVSKLTHFPGAFRV